MVKVKGRKKPFPGSSAALRAESQASEDAPDNPGTIPEVERLSSIGDDPIALRRSSRLHLMEAGIIRNDSEQNTNKFVLTGSAGNSAREPNDVKQRHNDGARSADALTGAPALVRLARMTKNGRHLSVRAPDLNPHPLMVTRLGPVKKISKFNDCLNSRLRSRKPGNA